MLKFVHRFNFIRSPEKNCGAFYNLEKVTTDTSYRFSCSICGLVLCASCQTSHPTLSCAEYKALPEHERNPEDLAFFDAAKRSAYARCKCGLFVEKIDGCSHVRCRCGHSFCYVQQRYSGPPAAAAAPPHMTDFERILAARTNPVTTTERASAYALEEARCAHAWRGCNRVLDHPRLCHLCQRNKRCFQSVCTKCRRRACSICKSML